MYDARLQESLPAVQERIGQASKRVGRTDEVRIIAVTKGHPVAAVRAAVNAGLNDCGENRVAELSEKVALLGRNVARWHLIGHLQRNKARQALELFDLVHSVDSLRLATELSKEAVNGQRTVRGLIQVNASGEATKGGIDVADDEMTQAVDAIRDITNLANLKVAGLMTMAPFVDDEALLRTTFARTRRLLEACRSRIDGFDGYELSMGMTNDFEIAIEEGSTMLRLGTILFGERVR